MLHEALLLGAQGLDPKTKLVDQSDPGAVAHQQGAHARDQPFELDLGFGRGAAFAERGAAPDHERRLPVARSIEQIADGQGRRQHRGRQIEAAIGRGLQAALGRADDQTPGEAHERFEQRLIAVAVPVLDATVGERGPHQIALELRGGGCWHARIDGFQRSLAGHGRAVLEQIPQFIQIGHQTGLPHPLAGERRGGVVDDPLGELTGAAEELVHLLDLLLQLLDDLGGRGGHGGERELEGIAGGVGGDGAQQVGELLDIDEGEGAAEQIDPPAAGLERRRDEGHQVGVDEAVARDHRPGREHPAPLAQVGRGFGDIDQSAEHGRHLRLQVGVRRHGGEQTPGQEEEPAVMGRWYGHGLPQSVGRKAGEWRAPSPAAWVRNHARKVSGSSGTGSRSPSARSRRSSVTSGRVRA